MAGSENTTTLPGCTNGLPKRGTGPGIHPDAELLFAWDAFTNAVTAYQCAPEGEDTPYEDVAFNIGMRIEEFRPKTMDGVACQLRYLLTKHIDMDDAWDVIIFGEDMTPNLKLVLDEDTHAGMLWRMIDSIDGAAERIARRGQTPRDIGRAPHPDVELLFAWDGYIAATRAYDLAGAVPGAPDKDLEPFSRALSTFGRKIEGTPARTMAGIAIQLRYLFAALVESHGAADAAIFGKAPSEALAADLEDHRYRLLWRMIEEAERGADAALGRNDGSTLIPALDMTFADASAKVLALLGDHQAATEASTDDPPDHLVVEACEIRLAVFTTLPRTPADALAVLNLLADDGAGLTAGNQVEGQETAMTLLRNFMARQVAPEQRV